MTPSSLHDASLYEVILNAEHPPQALQISSTTFKSIVTTFLDVLIERRIPATLLLHLPPQANWQAEIDRYYKSAGAPHSVYRLQTDQAEETNSLITTTTHSKSHALASEPTVSKIVAIDDYDLDDCDLVDKQGLFSSSVVHLTQSLVLPLAAESQLQRDYFLLVLSSEFCGLVLVHSPRSIQSDDSDPLSEFVEVRRESENLLSAPQQEPPHPDNSALLSDETLNRKHALLGVCSFESDILRRALTVIHQAVQVGQWGGSPNPKVDELLQNWDGLINSTAIDNPNPAVLEHLLARQIQQQQAIWQNSTTSRRQAEATTTLQMENEKLLNAIRLKDEFLKTVGQELRTPLTSMKTAVTLLGSPSLKPSQRQRYIELLTQECDRQSALITSVLDLIQLENAIEQTPAQPLRLIDIVPGVVSIYQPLAQEKGITLSCAMPEDLPAVSCSNAWLRQIIINLLHNGIKFTPQGGRVRVKSKHQGDYVQLEFHDTGIGIASADIPKVFDRFYKVRSSAADDLGGTGLGLSIVQQLLLRCGGSISVLSKVGEGSIFIVLLPLYR